MVEPSTVEKKSRFWLIFPLVIFALIVAAWTAYWVYAKGQLEAGIDQWIADEKARGATVEFSSKSLGGYPFRFELDVRDPVYQPVGEPRWDGERLRLVMQPWNYNHIIGFAPGRNLITEETGLRHTVNLDPTSAMSLSWDKESVKRIGFQVGSGSALIQGETYAVSGFSLNLAPRKGAPDDMMVAVQWDELKINAPPPDADFLGDTLGPTRLIGEVRKFYPAWRAARGETERLPGALMAEEGGVEVAQLLLDWGPLDFGAKGDVGFEGGRTNGSFGIRIDNADELRAAMEAAGRLSNEEAAGVAMLEGASKDGGFLTFTIKDDEVFMGPLKVGRLPGPGF